jgi:tetratricopeptide (TPR) repeat protein
MVYLNKKDPESIRAGSEMLQERLRQNPDDALAYTGLALAARKIPGPPDSVMTKSKAFAIKALDLDSTIALAHALLGEVYQYYEWNWDGAEHAFRSALRLNPSLARSHYHYGWYFDITRQYDAAEKEMKVAAVTDPLTPVYPAWLAGWYWSRQRYEEAYSEAEHALELNPNNAIAFYVLGLVHHSRGEYEEAIRMHKESVSRSPMWASGLAVAYAASGKEEEARAVAKQMIDSKNPFASFGLAEIYASLGEKDEAFKWLEVAYELPHPFVPWIGWSPLMSSLRSDKRFAALKERMGVK